MKRHQIALSVVAAVSVALAASGRPPDSSASAVVTLPVIAQPDFSELPLWPVQRVIDGDTVVLLDPKGQPVVVRLIGVDTPETVHPRKKVQRYGKEASVFLTNLLKGERVYLVGDPPLGMVGRYGRRLGYLYRAPDGLFVNAEIVRQGYGHAAAGFPFQFAEEFKQLEQFATRAGKGLWAPDAGGRLPDGAEGRP